MLSRFLGVWLAACLMGQTTNTPLKVEVRTEAAQCDAIARGGGTACLKYTQPPFPETVGVKTPAFAIIRVTGTEGAAVVIQAFVQSPENRQWLHVRRVGAPVGGTTISDVLPQDVEIYVDEAQALDMHAGRFVGTVVVTAAGAAAPVKLPVQLTVDPDTDSIAASPDFVPDLTVNATANPQPLRVSISLGRNGVGPPFQISVTPETSDGGAWLSADLQAGFVPCSTEMVPCEFDAIVTPPQATGDYWGVLVISGAGYADRVAVRVKVNSALGENPPTIDPRLVTLSAPLGSTTPVKADVTVKGGYDGLAFRAVNTDPWLTVDPTATHWPGVLKLTANPAGLDAGLYTEVVQLRAVDTNELLGTIAVNFTITAPVYLPSLFDGGGWKSTLYLVNPGAKEIKANVRFWSTPREAGEAWLVGLQGRGLLTAIENEVIPPLGMKVIETQGAQANRQQGWAEVSADGPVSAQVVLSESKTIAGGRSFPVDATVPLGNVFRDRLLLPFDSTGSSALSFWAANPEDQPVTVGVTVLNENGAEVAKEAAFTVAAQGAVTIDLGTRWLSTAKRRGLVALEFDGHRLLATGLRAQGFGFYAYPAVARGEPGAERGLARVTAGGAWQSTAYFTNASTIPQNGSLRVWPDVSRGPGTGLAEESAAPVPANGALVWQATPAEGVRTDSGWLEMRYPKQVGGFLLLRENFVSPGSAQVFESALAGQIGMNGRIAIPFDYRGSASTQIVLVNTNDEPTEIQTVIYDLGGRFPRLGDAFKLPGKGQALIDGAARWELGGQQGILTFSSRQSYRLAGVGLRSGDGPATILPAFEK